MLFSCYGFLQPSCFEVAFGAMDGVMLSDIL